jgi:arylsulfatase A-like enzyme
MLLLLLSANIKAQDKPNIVFILIDDMGWKDLGYMGSDYYESPNIDKLAKNGMVFTNAYANAANCAPTRASLLTGQHTSRHGIFTVSSSARGKSKDRRLIPTENSLQISLDKVTIAESLNKAGYVSAAIGKWHVGRKPEEHGFDYSIDRETLKVRGHFKKNGEYLTDMLTEEAVDFVKNNNPKKTGKPFFLYLAHHAVHTPIQAKKDMIKSFKNKPTDGCHNHATYAAMIESVDESVAGVNKVLEERETRNHLR